MTALDAGAVAVNQSEHRTLGGGHVRLSGIMARDVAGDIAAQTRDVFEIVDARLADLGIDQRSLLAVHIWLHDMSLFQGMTAEWNNWIGDLPPPSRSCVSGTPVVPGALLEVEVVAVLPGAILSPQEIQRFGLVRGPGRPTMCLALRHGAWFTVCTLASDCSVGVIGQTQQILDVFDGFMVEAGIVRAHACKLEIWLKHVSDFDAVNEVLEAWFAPGPLPAASVVGANMANPDMLIEIRLTATTSDLSR